MESFQNPFLAQIIFVTFQLIIKTPTRSNKILLFLLTSVMVLTFVSCRKKFDIKKKGNIIYFKLVCSSPSSSDAYTVGYTSEANTVKFEDIQFPGDSIRTFSTTLSKKDQYYFSVIPKQNSACKLEMYVNEKLYNYVYLARPTAGNSYELVGKLKSY